MRRISLLLLLLPLLAAATKKEPPVSLVVDDVPVVQVLQSLAEMQNLNVIVAPEVSGTLSLHLNSVPWRQALQSVVDSAGLTMARQGTVLYIHTQAWQQAKRAQQEAEQARRWQNLDRKSVV